MCDLSRAWQPVENDTARGACSLLPSSVSASPFPNPPSFHQLSVPTSTCFTSFSASHARLAPLRLSASFAEELRDASNSQAAKKFGAPLADARADPRQAKQNAASATAGMPAGEAARMLP